MQQFAKLIGIARLASEGSLLQEKRRVEYRSLPTRKWLNRCHSQRVPFDWTINPYRGCEFGCKYCYARFTHEFLELGEPDSFETEIYAKDWSAGDFRQELKSLRSGQVVGLGTATDPYQPAERKFERTRVLLEALVAAGLSGIGLYITTKSDLAARDADLFRELARKNDVRVTFSITTMDGSLTRLIEPFAPRPDLRMAAVRALAAAGVATGVIASPILPLITDSGASLTGVAEASKAAGATRFGANVLFLQPSAQRVFFPFLAEQFPGCLDRYRRAYSSGAFLKGSYPETIRRRVSDIRQSTGMLDRDFGNVAAPELPATFEEPQLMLF